MTVVSAIWHGGDLDTAKRLFPDAPDPWLDLSTGINPIPYPLPDIPASAWQRLPGRAEEAGLLAAARRAYGVPADAGLIAAPGTQILIELLPALGRAGDRIAVVGPTYGEHVRTWRKAGHEVAEVQSLAEAGDARVLVLVNPNNPDGGIVAPGELDDVARRFAARGGLIIVDEAFADFEPGTSIVPTLPPSTLVLRSFGKTYGLAGLRLGFAVARGDLTARLAERLGPWAVPGPALVVGTTALADRGWRDAAARARAGDAERLDRLLAKIGRVIGGTSLFRLVETEQAADLFDRLGRHGIYVRRFQDQPLRLRFGLPAGEAAWSRLAAALAG
ncbi:threonine-phosphate decarboxylase CobD [Phreatobacter stygius]|uniref:threonine-phosphate decarboxylase n=1 Tax=Phreatobacter stygius TaxID=1940610 RepID=A0A4D7BKM5_9HYPH|nr:threonine-phosphate decarboxylase CobD [Phreatobacter stygius]QCI68297.1 threonine-phosphate decarboxylase [Phreatobacter stygius]